MKVACIGNMNNNFFALVRHLRDRGIDAELLLFNEQGQFLPHTDTYNLEYQKYTKQLTWDYRQFFQPGLKLKIVEDIKKYDFIIGSYYVPAFLNLIGRKLDLFLPYGGDLYQLPFIRKKKNIPLISRKNIRSEIAIYQLNGIKESRYLFLRETDPEFESIIAQTGFSGERIKLDPPIIYTNDYCKEGIDKFYHYTHWHHEFKKIRNENDLIIFHHPRHSWKYPPNKWSDKSNHILLEGYSRFIKYNSNLKSKLITLEYGPDLDFSKSLIQELGIVDYIKWFPPMYRKDIMVGISMSDLGAGQFSIGGITYGVILEYLAMNIPVMGYRDDILFSKYYDSLYPMMNAKTPEDIEKHLENYVENKQFYKLMANDSNLWFRENVIEKPLNKMIEIISNHK